MSYISRDWPWSESYDVAKSRLDRLSLVTPRHLNGNRKQHLIFLDVQHFEPTDIEVALVDGYVHIKGKHSEREDVHGWVERSFSRKIKIPDDVSTDSLESHLSSDGILTIKAGNRESTNQKKTYVIPVQIESN